MKPEVFVRMKHISKSFGQVKANQEVNFEVNKGEIHALLGENGAGKSTLMNMLSGFYRPDSGSIFIHGKEVRFTSPKDAIKMGIGMIHQHYKLVDVMSAGENIMLGRENKLFHRPASRYRKIKELADTYGLPIDPSKKVYDMSIGEKQAVEILKVLYSGADILIMDEPTAVLTPQETEKLFQIMRNMARLGCAIIIITHKLDEVMAISDRVTVLRKGQTVKTLWTKDTSPGALTDLMVGAAVNLAIERFEQPRGIELLRVEHLNAVNHEGVRVIKDLSFSLYQGEILGVAAVAGSGQKELCEAIAGLHPVDTGEVIYEEESILGLSPGEIINRGISMSFIPEDRLGMGLVASMDMVDNYLIKDHHQQKGFFLKRKPLEEKCRKLIQQLDISTPGIHHPVKRLSGGNIQKVLIGREIETNPHVLITAYAVRGLDINASHTIYDLLNEQKKKKVGILFIGEDLDVLMALCDRIMVLSEGQVMGIVDARHTSKEKIGRMMSGQKEDPTC